MDHDSRNTKQPERRPGWLKLKLLEATAANDAVNWSTIAASIGEDKGTVSRFLNHEGKFSLSQLETVLDVLGLTVQGADLDLVEIPAEDLRALRHLLARELSR